MNNRNNPVVKNPKCNKTLFTVIIAIIHNRKSVTGKYYLDINKINSMFFNI